MQKYHKSISIIFSACYLFYCQDAGAYDKTNSNFPSWDGSTYISNWGSGPNVTKTYGQLFYHESSLFYDFTSSFSLYFKLLSGAPQSYVFSIYRTSGLGYTPLNPILSDPLSTNLSTIFSTGILTAPSSTDSFTKVIHDVGFLGLSPVDGYIASISTLNIANLDGKYALAGISGHSGFRYTNLDALDTTWNGLDAALVYDVTLSGYSSEISN